MRYPTLLMCLLLAVFPVQAADSIKLYLILNKIEQVSAQEPDQDELYFDLREKLTQIEQINYQIPFYPLHWSSKNLPEVKNLLLWRVYLQDKESSELVLTLAEQDVLPDDYIGSIRLNLTNVGGKLMQKWQHEGHPTEKQGNFSLPTRKEFTLGDKQSGIYKVYISLHEGD